MLVEHFQHLRHLKQFLIEEELELRKQELALQQEKDNSKLS